MDTAKAIEEPKGFWAKAKTIKFTDKALWLFFLISGLGSIIKMVWMTGTPIWILKQAGMAKEAISTWDSASSFIGSVVVIVFGSIADWLGLRRFMLIVFSGLLLSRLAKLAVLLISGQEANPYGWLSAFAILEVFDSMVITIVYTAMRRYTLPISRVMAAVFLYGIVDLVAGMFGALAYIGITAFSGEENSALPCSSAAVAFSLLTLFIIWRWMRREEQSIATDGAMAAQNIERPSRPFAGFVESLKNPDIHRALALAFVYLFLSAFTRISRTIFTQYNYNGSWLSDTEVGHLMATASTLGYFGILLVATPIGKLSIQKTFFACASVSLFGALLMMIPVSESLLVPITFTAVMLVEAAEWLLFIRFFEYLCNASKPGYEGSMLAIIAITWPLRSLFGMGLRQVAGSAILNDFAETLVTQSGIEMSSGQLLWPVVLVPTLIGILLLWKLRRWIFDEPSWKDNPI